ncbi:glycosyltransferase family 2 protein [Lactobacillus delbrueckii]|uniref:glycosyltransferase family 2 protein n=1 Tax=Lactobacillus delbrueckii TaxID=1584 RepID=UPI001F2C92AF|nr:glycosyltransferase [Lactobacillus delbrueckii]GHN40575.1 glycosyl transferase [Lactobacillus delbrueckii]
MPKVSVIMSTYNCKSYKALEKSIRSIVDQTYSDWEFIIYNDGSKDGGKTSDYLKKLGKLDSRIQIIDCPDNHGLAYAKNEMIKVARGKYITAQDDDDVSCPTRLAKEVNFLDNHPEYAFVGTVATVFDTNGTWGHYDLKERPTRKTFLWNSPFLHPSVMFRREILDQVNGYRVAKETLRAEDYDLFFRLYSKGYKGYNIQEDLYEYRIDNDPNKKYRPMSDRIQEAKVRYKGFKSFGMLTKGLPYVIKPILIGLIPQKIFYVIKKNRY